MAMTVERGHSHAVWIVTPKKDLTVGEILEFLGEGDYFTKYGEAVECVEGGGWLFEVQMEVQFTRKARFEVLDGGA